MDNSSGQSASGVLDHMADLHRRIYATLLSSLTENWMGIDYTMPQLKVLLCLYINGPYRMGDLAGALAVSTPPATGIVAPVAVVSQNVILVFTQMERAFIGIVFGN